MTTPKSCSSAQPQAHSSLAPQSKLYHSPPLAWLHLSWPIIVVLGILIGFTLDLQCGRAALLFALHSSNNALAHRPVADGPTEDRVLIVTSNDNKRLNVILTLSPRGLEPLLAQSLDDVNAIVPSHASRIRLFVV